MSTTEAVKLEPGWWVCANGIVAEYSEPSENWPPFVWMTLTVDGERQDHLYAPDGEYVRQSEYEPAEAVCIERREGYRIVGPRPSTEQADRLSSLESEISRLQSELDRLTAIIDDEHRQLLRDLILASYAKHEPGTHPSVVIKDAKAMFAAIEKEAG